MWLSSGSKCTVFSLFSNIHLSPALYRHDEATVSNEGKKGKQAGKEEEKRWARIVKHFLPKKGEEPWAVLSGPTCN